MKKNTRNLFLIGAAVLMLFFAAACTSAPPKEESLPGGFSPMDLSAPEVREAFEVLKAHLEEESPGIVLSFPEEAWSQVVAGYNIRLNCPWKNQKTGEKGGLSAVIYFNLKGEGEVLELDGER